MLNLLRARLLPASLLAAMIAATASFVAAEDIDPLNDNSQFAWGENVGWINAEPSGPSGPGIDVTHTELLGYMWGENIGWINLNCKNNNTCGAVQFGVTNDFGDLGGYAWGENVGWISFCDQDTPGACKAAGSEYRVTINLADGVFSGFAWGENIGWISFSDDAPVAYKVQTDMNDGDTDAGPSDNCPWDANQDQTNTDSGPPPPTGNTGTIGNGAFLPGHDATVPGGDRDGDGCDDDNDNDLIPNDVDPQPGVPRDVTVDDDGDGQAALGCFGGNDASDDGVSWDHDCDGRLDGAPSDCGSISLDADGDGLRDAWETCHWRSSNALQDSDVDGFGDCVEAFDMNSNAIVTNSDAVFIQQAAFGVNPSDWDFDINGNGSITNADAVFIQRAVFGVFGCI